MTVGHGDVSSFQDPGAYTLSPEEALSRVDPGGKLGLQIIHANDRHLQLDLDTTKGCRLNSRVETVLFAFGLIPHNQCYLSTVSRNGGTHLYIPLHVELSANMRIALQAALGSDPTREALNAIDCEFGGGQADICLFETPDEAKRVREWLEEAL